MILKYLFSGAIGAFLSAVVFSLVSQQQITLIDTATTSKVINSPTDEAVKFQTKQPSDDNGSKPIFATTQMDDLVAENEKLREQIEALEQRLKFHKSARVELVKARAMANKHEQIQKSIKAQKQDKPWADKDIEKAYPAPFADFMKNLQGVYSASSAINITV